MRILGDENCSNHSIAEATVNGIVPAREVAVTMTDHALIERLVSLRGVGRLDCRDAANLHA
jgi:hypothetical protein